MSGPFRHVEAYCLMTYRDTAGNEEAIWNSRDGVTPFIITSRQGLEAQHVDWYKDRRVPYHVPRVGDRIFVDLTRDRALAKAQGYVDRKWDHPEFPMSQHDFLGQLGKEGAAQHLADAWYDEGHSPDLVEVTAEWLSVWLAGRSQIIGGARWA